MPKEQVVTKIIDNFQGDMTIYNFGDMNSGKSNVFQTFGNNPFFAPGQLTWYNDTVQIDPMGSVITDLIMAGQERVESGILYVYCIGHTGRLYKIQVNDPASHNPDYDNPVLLATLTSGSPTFTRGGFINFYGSTERIYIGHDKGVTRIDFDGTNETAISGTWVQNVPRQFKQFIGKLYIGNGSNIAEIDSTGTVTTSTKLSPGFPDNTQVRDMDYSLDGNYLEMVVSRLALGDITSTIQDTTQTANSESYIFKWNGTDIGYTTFDSFPTFSLGANITFQDYQYTFGTDQLGMAIFNPTQKIITEPEAQTPLPNAVTSYGNIVSWFEILYFEGVTYLLNNQFGPLDHLVQGSGYHSVIFQTATGTETDVVRVPFQMIVSNFGLGSSTNGYTNSIFGTAKTYFSTLETSSSPTTAYKFYKWDNSPSPEIPNNNPPALGAYQTQTQMFSKRQKIKEVRIYANPWIAGNSFQVDLVGPDGEPILNGTRIFTAGSTLPIGEDFVWFDPMMDRTYALAIRITQLGTTNFMINKIEVDLSPGGE